jgi:hypothetical protein
MQLQLDLGLNCQDLKMEKTRGFNVVSKYATESVQMPKRATKLAAGYDVFNNTGADIVIQPGELSGAVTTKIKAYMLEDEVLMIYPRSGQGFKYSVRLANTVGIIDCVPGNTLISTPTGDYTIYDILEKEIKNIYSYNEELDTIEEDLLKDIVEVYGINMVEIITEISTIQIPETKELYTKRGWIKAKDLTLDDEILSII